MLGIVGKNGIGKSTVVKILGGAIMPNLGNYEEKPNWKDILNFFRGSELKHYFTNQLDNNLRTI